MKTQKIHIEYRRGDMFWDAMPGTVFVHSCNCQGQWGKGIAEQFKARYPVAFEAQREYCSQHQMHSLLGKSMLVPPGENDTCQMPGSQHFVACLFTKAKTGRAKSEQEVKGVLAATRSALQHLLDGLAGLRGNGSLEDVGELRMPKLNSGLFQVPWERTLEILEGLEVPIQETSIAMQKLVVYTR